MIPTRRERRRTIQGSIVCDNGALRLRVVREGSSLGLMLDACDADGSWVTMASTPVEGDVRCTSPQEQEETAWYSSYIPVYVGGQTRGVTLHGRLGRASITSSVLLDSAGTWCQQQIEIRGLSRVACTRLTQSWSLSPAWMFADVCWPPAPVRGGDLAANPAAVLQAGPHFLALTPDLEEGDCTALGLHLHLQEQPRIEYGLMMPDGQPTFLPPTVRLACAMCADARALPMRGFQQVVRQLGSREALRLAAPRAAQPVPEPLPELPPAPDTNAWYPFHEEGSPVAIAAAVRNCLAGAEGDNWEMLEDGLCWLDRLCLHQRVFEVPGGAPLGSVGRGPEWDTVALWLPELLLDAHRLTGIPEYATRAIAAFTALPAERQAQVLGQLYPKYGDLFVHADSLEVSSLTGFRVSGTSTSPESIDLRVDGPCPDHPLRLVLEGAEERYAVSVNQTPLGSLPTAKLRAGLDLPSRIIR